MPQSKPRDRNSRPSVGPPHKECCYNCCHDRHCCCCCHVIRQLQLQLSSSPALPQLLPPDDPTDCKGQREAPSSQRAPVALTCCCCRCWCPTLLLLHCWSRPQRRAARAAGRYNKGATKPKHDEPPASLIARSSSENDTTISNTMEPAETARTAAPPALPGLQ